MTYNKRTWLNPQISDSTGSVVTFDGLVKDAEGKLYPQTFIEIADCRNKIRLHKNPEDSMQDFTNKLSVLKADIEEFINYLELNYVNL